MSLSRTDGMTASEKLQQRAEQKQMETENTLLKAALAESSERCEKSLKESTDLLRTAEQKRLQEQQRWNELHEMKQQELNRNVNEHLQKLNESVASLKTVNQSLTDTISSQISELVDSVRAATVEEVQAALAADRAALTRATADFQAKLTECGENFENKTADIESRLDTKLKELEQKQRRFFAFNGVKHIVFWAQPFLTFVGIALLVWFLFFQ